MSHLTRSKKTRSSEGIHNELLKLLSKWGIFCENKFTGNVTEAGRCRRLFSIINASKGQTCTL